MTKTKLSRYQITTLLLLIVFLIFAAYLWSSGKEGRDLTNSTTNQQPINTPEHPDTAEVKTEPGSPVKNSPTNSEQYTPVITRISQKGETIIVRAYVPTFDKGECVLLFEKGDEVITKTSGVSAQPSYLQCNGFDIGTSELGQNYRGLWSVKIIYKINGQEYESQSQDISIP